MGKSFAERLPGFLRTYKTEKFIRVDVPRVGIFYRTCQLLALGLVFLQIYVDGAWAMSEVPGVIQTSATEVVGSDWAMERSISDRRERARGTSCNQPDQPVSGCVLYKKSC